MLLPSQEVQPWMRGAVKDSEFMGEWKWVCTCIRVSLVVSLYWCGCEDYQADIGWVEVMKRFSLSDHGLSSITLGKGILHYSLQCTLKHLSIICQIYLPKFWKTRMIRNDNLFFSPRNATVLLLQSSSYYSLCHFIIAFPLIMEWTFYEYSTWAISAFSLALWKPGRIKPST